MRTQKHFAQFQTGLNQLALLPDSPERRRQELEICSVLGTVLRAAKGLAAAETGQIFARARELWQQLDYPAEFLRVPFGQSVYHAYRGELDVALYLDEDLLRISRQRNDTAGLLLGYAISGHNLLFAGKFASSRSHLEEALALYDPISHSSLDHQTGANPKVQSLAFLGTSLFCLGFLDRLWRGAAQQSLRLGGLLIRRLWR
jgi:hypothetical protein